jgi:hypothetical protein
MMTALLRDSTNYARRSCWFSADSLDARVTTPDCRLITTKRLKISSCKAPTARSRSQSCPRGEPKSVSPLPNFHHPRA